MPRHPEQILIAFAAGLAFFVAGDAAFAAASALAAAPSFSGLWQRAWKERQLFDPPEAGPGPVTGDPRFPHKDMSSPWVADLASPILQPATKARLKQIGDEEIAGRPYLKNDTLCLPVGPAAVLNLFDQMQILQTPAEIVFLYATDQQIRIARLNAAHRSGAAHNWFGDSVAHYEGDTLVVDTIGMNDKTYVDRFGTTHSDRMHMVERYRLIPERKVLEVTASVEDPVAFTTPWSARVEYHHDRADAHWSEIVCAENNRPASDNYPLPIPTASKPDF